MMVHLVLAKIQQASSLFMQQLMGRNFYQQFPLMTCESYVIMVADSCPSVSTIRFRLLKRLLRSDTTQYLVASRPI
jgi:hypothetical protein